MVVDLPGVEPPTHDVGAELDEEDGDAAQGQGDAGRDVDEVRRQLGDVLGQRVGNGLLQVVEDQAAWRRAAGVTSPWSDVTMG